MSQSQHCFIQNQKKLFGTTYNFSLEVHLATAILREIEVLQNSSNATKQQAATTFIQHFTDFLAVATKHTPYNVPCFSWRLPPCGWSNSMQTIEISADMLLQQWKSFENITKAITVFQNTLNFSDDDNHFFQHSKCSQFFTSLKAALPSKFNFQSTSKYLISDFSPLDYHRSNEAFAIFMAGSSKGFMNDSKKAASIGCARLFESKAAALRTAKAANFGATSLQTRGPAFIVQLDVQAQYCAFTSDKKTPAGCIQEHFALLEAKAIENAIEESSFNTLLERLKIIDPIAYQKILQSSQIHQLQQKESFNQSTFEQNHPLKTLAPSIETNYSHLIKACTENLGGFAHWHYTPENLQLHRPESMGYFDKHHELGRISGASFEDNETKIKHIINNTFHGSQSVAVFAQMRPCALVETLGDVPEYSTLEQFVAQCNSAHLLTLMEKSQNKDLIKALENQIELFHSQHSNPPHSTHTSINSSKVRRI